MATPEQQWSSGERHPWDGGDEGPAGRRSRGDDGADGRFLTRRERRLAEAGAAPSLASRDDFSFEAPPRVDGVPDAALEPGGPRNGGSRNGGSRNGGSRNGGSRNGGSRNGGALNGSPHDPAPVAPAPVPVLQPRWSGAAAPSTPTAIGRTPLPDSVRRPARSPFEPAALMPPADRASSPAAAPAPAAGPAVQTPRPVLPVPAAPTPSGTGWRGEVAAYRPPPGSAGGPAAVGGPSARDWQGHDDAAVTEAVPVAAQRGPFGPASVDGIRGALPPTRNGATPADSWPAGDPPAAGAAGTKSGPKGPPPSMGKRLMRDAREVLGTVAVALGIAIVIKTFLVQPFKIPSQSMQDTLLVGDRVLVSKLEPGPLSLQRGDVVVFLDPGGWLDGVDSPEQQGVVNQALTFIGLLPANSGEHLIKRVIGLPGDTVKCCDADGRLLINNQPIDETAYIYPGDQPSADDFQVTIPDGTLWVMGDHRSVSRDSRFHAVDGDLSAGAVPLDNVVGRAVLVSWPLSRWDWLGRPEGVFDGVGQLDGVK